MAKEKKFNYLKKITRLPELRKQVVIPGMHNYKPKTDNYYKVFVNELPFLFVNLQQAKEFVKSWGVMRVKDFITDIDDKIYQYQRGRKTNKYVVIYVDSHKVSFSHLQSDRRY